MLDTHSLHDEDQERNNYVANVFYNRANVTCNFSSTDTPCMLTSTYGQLGEPRIREPQVAQFHSCRLAHLTAPDSNKLLRVSTSRPRCEFDETFDEEADEVFSDEEDDMVCEGLGCQDEADITSKLLHFVERVNCDIKRYFGRKKGDGDSCDIYEDKWKSRGKSGRELYYADLLRMARGYTDEQKNVEDSLLNYSNITDTDEVNGIKHIGESGKLNKGAGLGPLSELFERSPQNLVDRGENGTNKEEGMGPMQNRNLPKSFWMEPSTTNQSVNENHENHEACKETDKTKFNKTETPKDPVKDTTKEADKDLDFSDLLDMWSGDDVMTNSMIRHHDH